MSDIGEDDGIIRRKDGGCVIEAAFIGIDFDGDAANAAEHPPNSFDGLVEKVYEFGGGKVREHLGGIYDFLEKKQLETLDQLHTAGSPSASQAQPKAEAKAVPSEGKLSYEEQKEQARKRRKAEKLVEQMEARVMALEEEKAELEASLSTPEGASDQKLFERYAQLGRELKEAEAAWEEALEALE